MDKQYICVCLLVFALFFRSNNNPQAAKEEGKEEEKKEEEEKEEPNFELSGKLTEFTNTYKVRITQEIFQYHRVEICMTFGAYIT